MIRPVALAAFCVGLLVLAGCGGSAAPADAPASDGSSDARLSGDLTVFAAASLTDAFTTIGDEFMEANPDTTVVFNFAGSSGLAQQITSGAPADVFASASQATMQTVVDSGDSAGEPTVFVTNSLEIAVPAGNPGRVSGLDDFANPDLTIALCSPDVPCGAASEKVFAAAGVTAAPDTLEQDVRAALSKVQLDEVDAALVYRTDIIAAGDAVEGIEFSEAAGAVTEYPITALTEAPNPDAAQAFVELALAPEGQEALGAAGFGSP